MDNAISMIKKYIIYIGYAGCGLMLLGSFLPLLKIDVWFYSTQMNYFETGDGKLFALCAIATAVLIYLKQPAKFTFISTGIAGGLILYLLFGSGSRWSSCY